MHSKANPPALQSTYHKGETTIELGRTEPCLKGPRQPSSRKRPVRSSRSGSGVRGTRLQLSERRSKCTRIATIITRILNNQVIPKDRNNNVTPLISGRNCTIGCPTASPSWRISSASMKGAHRQALDQAMMPCASLLQHVRMQSIVC